MIQVAICDDDMEFRNNVNTLIRDILIKNKIQVKITSYENGFCLLADVEEGIYYDLYVLDIEMPYIDGMKLATRVKEYFPEVLVIFITSYIKYAVDAFELSIFRYIPKISLQERLETAIQDAVSIINIQKEQSYIIDTSNRLEKIPYNTILYITKDQKKCLLKLTNRLTHIRKTLAEVYKDLNPKEFIYIEKGCIINIIHVMTIKNNKILLKDGSELIVSRTHIQKVKNLIIAYWGGLL